MTTIHDRRRIQARRRRALTMVPAAGVLAAIVTVANPITALAGVEIGVLTCRTLPETYVDWVASYSIRLRCVLQTSAGQAVYLADAGGHTAVDLRRHPDRELRYTVLAPRQGAQVGPHALNGHYSRAGMNGALSPAAGASTLFDGHARGISLEPVGEEAERAAGGSPTVSYLVLNTVR